MTHFAWALIVFILFLPNVARTEIRNMDISIAGFVGAAHPFKTDVQETNPSTNITLRDIKLDSSTSYGGKISAWLTKFRAEQKTRLDFGVELDVTQFRPTAGAQTANGSGTVLGIPISGAFSTNRIEMTSTIIAMNVLVRLPVGVTEELPNGRWYPYLGVGGGVSRTSFGREGVAVAPAFQALAGLKVFLVRNLGLFLEYKFTHADHTLEFVSGSTTTKDDLTINANHFVGGIAFHFSP